MSPFWAGAGGSTGLTAGAGRGASVAGAGGEAAPPPCARQAAGGIIAPIRTTAIMVDLTDMDRLLGFRLPAYMAIPLNDIRFASLSGSVSMWRFWLCADVIYDRRAFRLRNRS